MKRSPILGYNHNMKHRGLVFHVQTEDSGVDKAHIFTHVFHGGVILKSRKLDYDAAAAEEAIKSLMQAQHKAALKELKGGELDGKIDAYLGDNPNLLPSAAAFEAARAAAAAADPIAEAANAIGEAADAVVAAARAAEQDSPVVEMIADEPSGPEMIIEPISEATQPIDLPDLIPLDAGIPDGTGGGGEIDLELELVAEAPDEIASRQIDMLAEATDPGAPEIEMMGEAERTIKVPTRPPPVPERSDPAIIHDAAPDDSERQRSVGSYSQVRRKRNTPGVPTVERIPTDKLPVVPPSVPIDAVPERETKSSQRLPERRPNSGSGGVPTQRAQGGSGSVPAPRAQTGSGGVPTPRAKTASGSIPIERSSRAASAKATPVPAKPSNRPAAGGKRAREASSPPVPATNPNPQRGVVVSRPAVIIGAPPKQVGLESSSARKARAETRRTNPRLAREERSRSSLFGKDLISEKSLDEVILAYLSEDGSEEK